MGVPGSVLVEIESCSLLSFVMYSHGEVSTLNIEAVSLEQACNDTEY